MTSYLACKHTSLPFRHPIRLSHPDARNNSRSNVRTGSSCVLLWNVLIWMMLCCSIVVACRVYRKMLARYDTCPATYCATLIAYVFYTCVSPGNALTPMSM